MNSFWERVIWGNTIKDWTIVASAVILALLVLRIFRHIILQRIKSFAEKSRSTFDDLLVDVIQSSLMPLLYCLAFYYGLQYLSLDARLDRALQVAILLATTFFVIRAINSTLSYFIFNFIKSQTHQETRKKQARGILLILKVITWVIGLIFIIDNLGYDITTVVTGLGIGGIAIALAAQTILGDLFSYLVIFFDKPFEVGDFIIVDDKLGTIEYIGVKTTRIRTLGGEQLICSNTDLTNSRVHNYKRMDQRRIVFGFRVVYQTPADVLEKIPVMVREIINSEKETIFDRAHFSSFGDYSLNFEVVYYVKSGDYNQYMDTQQRINLKLLRQLQQEGIEFAIPRQILSFDNPDAMAPVQK